MKVFTIALMPGDGIGPDIVPPCYELLRDAAAATGGFSLERVDIEAGAAHYRKTGDGFPEERFEAAKKADAILLGAMGLPDVRYPDGREITPQLELRERLDLYAGVRPVKVYPGVPPILASEKYPEIDFVLVRESTEGLFAFRAEGVVENDSAREVLQLTRRGCERIYDFSFNLVRRRKNQGGKNRLTCVDKANVFRSFKFARDIFAERSKRHPDVRVDYCYVDAMAMNMVKRPWDYDVMVMENQFGDILSDLGAALMGGLGMAPSADIGDAHAVFQPCHGSAPDIMGQDKANPLAMFLSGVLLLDWLADTRDCPEAGAAARLVENAIVQTLASGTIKPFEFGGTTGTRAISDAVRETLAKMS
ncbi:MAG: isocitrate/isopropylmalate family dehydrogenase [Planctomycetes bacterium]|nr:isocitrate/isopropylmalate family dehydrogenase [Planctomycetota bacterium]